MGAPHSLQVIVSRSPSDVISTLTLILNNIITILLFLLSNFEYHASAFNHSIGSSFKEQVKQTSVFGAAR
jgi:hypothetical protein